MKQPAIVPDSATNRFMMVDVIRGIAILLMIIYHFSWDLTFFGLAEFQIFSNPYWIWFAKFIAGLILLVMGVAHVMARRTGVNSRVFLKRLGLIAVAAGAVSAGTYYIDPQTFVYFGILHHITVASIVLALTGGLSSALLFLLAMVFLTGSQVLAHDVFSPFWLAWTGLGPYTWPSVDYLPLFPWLGVPLFGMVLGRWMLHLDREYQFLKWQSDNPFIRMVNFAGRHSLLVYLLHQPILFGSLYAVLSFTSY